MPLHFPAFIRAEDDRLGAIVEDLARHAAQRREGGLVHAQEGRQGLVESQIGEAGAGMAQGHHEEGDGLLAGGAFKMAQMAPVDLSLVPRGRLEATNGGGLSRRSQRRQIPLEDGITAGVTARLEFLEENDGVPGTLGEAIVEIRLEGIEVGGTRSAGSVSRGLGEKEVLANGPAVKAGMGGDLGDRKALTQRVVGFRSRRLLVARGPPLPLQGCDGLVIRFRVSIFKRAF